MPNIAIMAPEWPGLATPTGFTVQDHAVMYGQGMVLHGG